MKRLLLTTALGLSLLASAAAVAADGYVVSNVTLRAGPDESYPSVGMLNAGATVVLDDCVSGWSWCDVGTPYGRGWVPGTYLQEDYQGQRVFVPEYGERIGIPFVVFDFNTYWAANYRNRPWYGQRERYSQFKPMYRPITIDINVHAQASKGPAHDEHGRNDTWHDGHPGDSHGHPNDNVEPRSPKDASKPPEKDAHARVEDKKPPQPKSAEPKASPKSSPEEDKGKTDARDPDQH